MRINVGCGQTPVEGWCNFDNSVSVRLAAVPLLGRLVTALRLVSRRQREFMRCAREAGIKWAEATRRIPVADGVAEVVYTSHMLEHLSRDQARLFLREAFRVLNAGGVLRISVPDLRQQIESYLADGDADVFVKALRMTRERPESFVERLKYMLVGFREHVWMYDGASLSRFVASVGFIDVRIMNEGSTKIPDPGGMNLRERGPGSVVVEAIKP